MVDTKFPSVELFQNEVQALVPVYANYAAANKTVRSLAKSRAISAITVSVNEPGIASEEFLSLEHVDPRVKVHLQVKNLGLYGNFRFLANIASKPWVVFCAVDDYLPPQVLDCLGAKQIPKDVNLVVFRQEVWKTIESPGGVYSEVEKVGTVADFVQPGGSRVLWDTLDPPPSWIFGLWRASFLRRKFPRRDFNWLDTYLLSAALIENSVLYSETSEAARIGSQEGRAPHAVGQTWRNPFGWFFQVISSRKLFLGSGITSIATNWRIRLYLKHALPRSYKIFSLSRHLLQSLGRSRNRPGGL